MSYDRTNPNLNTSAARVERDARTNERIQENAATASKVAAMRRDEMPLGDGGPQVEARQGVREPYAKVLQRSRTNSAQASTGVGEKAQGHSGRLLIIASRPFSPKNVEMFVRSVKAGERG